MQNSNSSGRALSTSKLFPLRGARAETRNRAKDELRRVINAVDRVRRWEKRWVPLRDSAVCVFKWVPVSGPTLTATLKPAVASKNAEPASGLTNNSSDSNLPRIAAEEDTNASAASAENSNDATNNGASRSDHNFVEGNGEDNGEDSSNAAFFGARRSLGVEDVFDSDSSNQTSSYGHRVDYGKRTAEGAARTDFSALMEEEAATKALDGNDGSPSPSKRKRSDS